MTRNRVLCLILFLASLPVIPGCAAKWLPLLGVRLARERDRNEEKIAEDSSSDSRPSRRIAADLDSSKNHVPKLIGNLARLVGENEENEETEREERGGRERRTKEGFGSGNSKGVSALTEDQQEAIEEEIEESREKARFDEPDKIQLWYLHQRTGGKPLDQGLYVKAKNQIRFMPQAIGDITNWTTLGPGNVGGRTRAFLVDPGTPATMYAAGVAGGIWKTTNSGGTWNPLDDFMANLAVDTMVFERQGTASVNSATIYAGTGEAAMPGDAVRGAGIFKSTNSGGTWSQLAATATSDFYYVAKLAASPNTANVIYAATKTGIWKTGDGGTSWSRVLKNDGTGGTTGTAVATIDGFLDVVVRTDLGTDNLLASNGNYFTSDGVYRSTDAGATWTRVLLPAGIGRASLAFAPSNQATAYALCADRVNGNRLLNVYKSTDGGATWSARVTNPASFDQTSPNWLLLTNPLSANFSSCFPGTNSLLNQGWYDNTIAVAPHNENVVFAGGIDWFRSDDGGANWGIISYWWKTWAPSIYVHADNHVLAFDPGWNGTSNQSLYVGNDGGLFKSANALAATASGTNNGICENGTCQVNWTNLNNNYQVTQFYHGLPFPGGSSYFGGAQDNGTNMGTDAGGINAWTNLYGGDGGWVSYNPGNSNTVFLEIQNKNLMRSTTGGTSPSDIVNGAGQVTESSSNFAFIVNYRMDPSNADVLWYGGKSPWRSSNASTAATASAVAWTESGTAILPSGSFKYITCWGIAPSDGNIVYVGTSTGKVFKCTTALSATSSTVWTDISTGLLANGWISWLEVDGSDSTGNTVYATQSTFSAGNHVYRTTNGGSTAWGNITNNLPDLPALCLAIQPNHPTNLYVGTDLGVFVSKNGGGTWAQMNTPGFANVCTYAVNFLNEYQLFAFTHGRSAFRATLQGNPTPTVTATPSPTRSSTRTPTKTATPSPTRTGTRTPTRTGTLSPTRTASLTPTPTRTASLTPTPTVTATLTATRSSTPTPTRSSTLSPTSSPSPSPTRSSTLSPTRTATKSPTRSSTRTPTRSATKSPTRSSTRTNTRSATKSPTRSSTRTKTSTATPSPTRTFTLSPTRTASLTPTPTRTASLTPTPTGTITPSPTRSATSSPTRTASRTPTATRSSTRTKTRTATKTPTRTFTLSPTRSATVTPTRTFTLTPTRSATPTPSPTRTASLTPTPTGTITPSPTRSATPSPTRTASRTPTATRSSTRTKTRTATKTPTRTFTLSPTRSATVTPTRTFTLTPTRSATPTPSPTRTASLTPTPTGTITPSPTRSATSSPTRTASRTPTATRSSTRTRTRTRTTTPTRSSTRTATGTATLSPTRTVTLSPTRTATTTGSGTITPSPTRSSTSTSTGTATLSPTRTASLTPTPTRTASLTATRSSTQTATRTATVTGSGTITPSPTRSSTQTSTRTASQTATRSSTRTATRTATSSPTRTATLSPTRTSSLTSTPTRSATLSPTRTASPTPTRSSTRTSTRSATRTATRTATLTPTQTRTATSTPTRTASLTSTPTRTATRTPTPAPTDSATPTPNMVRDWEVYE